VLKGRIAYMAPEQAWGQPVDRRADVYAAGVMLWEAATGRRLWPGKNEVEILATMLREAPPSPRFVRPETPAALEAICMRALARDPKDRYPSAAALVADLEGYLARRPDAMSMRDVGGLVAAVFAEERRKTSALIDETLSRVRGSAPRSGVMLTLEGHTRGTPSGASRVLPSPGNILGSLQPSAASVAPQQTSWRTWTTGRATIAGAVAGALVLLVLILAATLGGEEPVGASAATHARAAQAPDTREVSDFLLEAPVETDADRNAAMAARWAFARSLPHPGKHPSTSAPTPEPPAPPPPTTPQATQAEVGPSGGRAPLRPIITSNPYGTP
jgi:serine/threonine-protein kinase